MTRRARAGIVLLAIAQGLTGCGGSSPNVASAPTAASTVPVPAGLTASDLVNLADSGHVLDTAFKRLAGVRSRCGGWAAGRRIDGQRRRGAVSAQRSVRPHEYVSAEPEMATVPPRRDSAQAPRVASRGSWSISSH